MKSDAVQQSSDTPKEPDHASANPQNEEATVEAKAQTGGDKKQRPPRQGKENDKQTPENEIMVAAKGQIKNYLGYAFRILNKTDHRKLTIRATGNAIVKALILIELVKRKVGEIYNYDLHQINKIYSMEIVSQEESKVPGMGQIESKRRVTAMDTILSKDSLDTTDPGYQFCKPEPKQEGQVTNQKKEGNFKKKGQAKGPRNYNQIDEEEKGGKQRRDENKDKHEQDNQRSKKDRKRGVNNSEPNDDFNAPHKDAKRGGKNQNSRRENLRNIINDDEIYPRPTETRGGRGTRGDRGGKRGGRFNGNPRDEYNQGPPPAGHHGSRYERRDNDHDRYQRPRSIDRYEARGERRGGGERRVPPEFQHPRGPPHHMPMRGGPPAQGGYYQKRGYNQDYYEDYDHGYSNYYGGPPMDRPRGGFGPPPHARYQDHPQYAMQYREPGQRPPRGGGPPRGGYPREFRGPPQDFEVGLPIRGRGGPIRGGPPRRGGNPDMQPRDHSPDMDHQPSRGRGGRGRGAFRGAPDEREFRGGFRGGPDSNRGDRGGRGGRGAPEGRGGYRGDRGARGGRQELEDVDEIPKIHKRTRGGPDSSK